MAEFASQTPMKASQGSALEHPVTEVEAVRSVLVQGLPLLDQELTESSIVQVFSSYGEISKLLLQTHDSSKSQRAVVVFAEKEAAVASVQANGRDILGSNCTVSLASSMPTLSDEVLGRENVSDDASANPSAPGGAAGRPVTAGEWLRRILAQGMVYTRLFDEKLHVSETAKALAAKARNFDETHNVSGRVAAAASTASAKAREVDARLKVSETAQRWARNAKESADKALENNPRVVSGVQQTGQAINSMVRQVSGLAQQAFEGARTQASPSTQGENASSAPTAATAPEGATDPSKN